MNLLYSFLVKKTHTSHKDLSRKSLTCSIFQAFRYAAAVGRGEREPREPHLERGLLLRG